MSKDFRNSETKDNLMRAFQGKARPGTVIPLRPHRHVKTASMSLKQFLPLPQIRKKNMRRSFTIISKNSAVKQSWWTEATRLIFIPM